MTKGQEAAADVAALLRARNSVIWIVTREEARVERLLIEAAAAASYIPQTWDVAQGTCDMDSRQLSATMDPGDALDEIKSRATGTNKRSMTIMRDLPVWLAGPPGATVMRKLRNLARFLPTVPRERANAIIILSPSGEVPPELANHATVLEWPMPDREEIAEILDASIRGLPDDVRANAAPNGTRDAAIDAAVGLSGEEASSCYARSLVQTKTIDPKLIAREKKRVIARERVLEWFDPIPGGLAAVGGLENLKTWLQARSAAYSPKAREYGLPAPKGAFLAGIPGCGKSLTAKAIATAWGVPLLKLDLGALKSKFVGDSEANLRKALRVIEAIGRCVVWLDEIEKALAGATQGAADGGVSSDALGAILNWMQERQGEAFVIATANDVEGLPPELMRKGRFDEIWWIDLPTRVERLEILHASLRSHGRKLQDLKADELSDIVSATDQFTGSEIAALVPDALYAAFGDDARPITTRDLLNAAKSVVPLSKTASEKLERLRTWAKGRARLASINETSTQSTDGDRVLEL
jgi:AAA+ superfamily predicted ATPase